VAGVLSPLILKPAPDTLACEIFKLAFPELLILTVCVFVTPDATLPNEMLEGVTEMLALPDCVCVEGTPEQAAGPILAAKPRPRKNTTALPLGFVFSGRLEDADHSPRAFPESISSPGTSVQSTTH